MTSLYDALESPPLPRVNLDFDLTGVSFRFSARSFFRFILRDVLLAPSVFFLAIISSDGGRSHDGDGDLSFCFSRLGRGTFAAYRKASHGKAVSHYRGSRAYVA